MMERRIILFLLRILFLVAVLKAFHWLYANPEPPITDEATINGYKDRHADFIIKTNENSKSTDQPKFFHRGSKPRKYASSSDPKSTQYTGVYHADDSKILNVHVIPHTHDDVGWLKTIDEYYHGWNNTIQLVCVRDILDSVIEALSENPHRTFVYVEIKFFQMWWEEQTQATRELVRMLVQETHQLTFANGGWCMHDEAATHYIGMIDQTTLGHNFLRKTFGYVPTVGWQLDPFGHSSTQASLLTHKVGFDALYFGRIDYQDLQLRLETRECEGLWNANGSSFETDNTDCMDYTSAQEDKSVFWGLTGSYYGNYGPPGDICFDPLCGPNQYRPLIEMNHTAQITVVEQFLMALRAQSDQTKGNHIMITVGEDFNYQQGAVNFANLDVLLTMIMEAQEVNGKHNEIDIPSIFGPEYEAVNVFYSSPEYYTRCKYNETILNDRKQPNSSGTPKSSSSASTGRELSQSYPGSSLPSSSAEVQWSVKYDDFFPYSDCPHCFWTGYFVSRPSLKKFERIGSSFLLAARQLESFTPDIDINNQNKNDNAVASSFRFRTSKQEIVHNNDSNNDDLYCDPQNMNELEDAMGVIQHHDGVSGTSKQHVAYDYAKRLQAGIDAVIPCTIRKLKRLLLGKENEDKHIKDLTYCQLLNETKCDVSVDATRKATVDGSLDLYVVVYNSLAFERSVVIDIPVASNGTFRIESLEEANNSSLTLVQARPAPFHSSTLNDGATDQKSKDLILSFMASSLPPVGAKIFRIRNDVTQTLPKLGKEKDLKPVAPNKFVMRTNKKNYLGTNLQKVSNKYFSLFVDKNSGDIFRFGSKGMDTLSSWGYYTSFDSEKDDDIPNNHRGENSGAYIFRPTSPVQELVAVPVKNSTIVHTAFGKEIHTEYQEPWIQTVAKIQNGLPYLEIEYQIGPIPIDDGLGKEVVTRYNTMVDNQGIFYTDSNGRDFIRRRRNHRPTWNLTVYEPIAGNYYPINTAIYVDEATIARNSRTKENFGRSTPPAFAVVTDRTQGGGSILDGTVELMVHRRTLADDARGVGEPINETDIGIDPCPPFGNATRIGKGLVIRGKHRILIENNNDANDDPQNKAADVTSSTGDDSSNFVPTCGGIGGARLARSIMDASFAEPLVFIGSSPSSEDVPFKTSSFSGVSESLPRNIMLITKKLLYTHPQQKTFLVRLGHQYGVGEDPDLSLPVDIDLSILFPGQTIREFQETTLSANRAVEDWRKERIDWNEFSRGRHSGKDRKRPMNKTNVITLTAMDIRTFIVTLVN